MFSRLFIQLRRQCQQECLKSGKCTKELTSGYHKGSSSGDKSTFWTEVLPFLIRTCQKNQVQKKASKNQDWQNFIDMVKRVERILTPRNATEAEQVRHDSRVFEVKIDVQHYEQGQLSVTISGDKLIIKGQHEMKEDEHGAISRQFHREYDIPEDVITETFQSSLEDGIMTLKADIEGAEDVEKKTIEIKFEKKKM